MGRHNVLNALAACAVRKLSGNSAGNMCRRAEKLRAVRHAPKNVPFAAITVVEDCYNASPDSMKAALSTLCAYPCGGRRVAVLGDSLSLERLHRGAHREVGEFAIKNDADSSLLMEKWHDIINRGN
jgi:UDP-N-acetylmuramoyl-tripeptide--D-alanyl-D-alanine ligase